MTKEQKNTAAKIFECNPNVKKLWVNPKGEFFTNENLAKGSLKEGEKLKNIVRTTEVTSTDVDAKELIELVKEQNIVSELEQLKLEEIDDKNRKTVIAAIEKRINELKSAENGES